MRVRESITPLVAAAVLAGCGTHKNETVTTPTATTTISTSEQAPASPLTDPTAAMQYELNQYRNKVIYGHKAAEILFGACVAWSNDSGGLTVTLNPGIGEVFSEGKKRNFFIFSNHDANYRPDWGPLNGPEVGSSDVVTLIFMPKVIPKGSIKNRKLSHHEKKGYGGRRFYRDIQTGAPVMDTILVNGPFTNERVAQTCDDLRQDEFEPMSATAA